MSLILKSNVVATASLGNLNGINGSQDWVYFADFDNEQIKKRQGGSIEYISATTLLNNIGSLSMAAKPVTYTKSKIESFVPNAQTLRFSHAGNGQYGLLAESVTRSNLFVNSALPVNQTTNIAATPRIIVSVKGSGSLTLSSPNFSESIIVTENSPQPITPISSVAASVTTATVSGTLTHAQVERVGSSLPVAASKITNNGVSSGQSLGFDKIALASDVLSEIKTGAFVLLMKVVFPKLLSASLPAATGSTILSAETLTKSNIVAFNISTNLIATSRMAQWTPELNAINGNILDLNESGFTIAAKYEGSTITTSINGGNPIAAQLSESVGNLTSIVLASLGAYGSASGGAFIIPKLVVYKKSMTVAELKKISSSWL